MTQISIVEALATSHLIAKLPTGSPCGLSREKAIELLTQLFDVTTERDRLRDELLVLGNSTSTS